MNSLKTFKTLTLAIILLLSINANAESYDDFINYEIAFLPLETKTDLSVRVTTTSNKPMIINELKDKFGTPNIHEYIKEVKALEGYLSSNKDSIFPDKNHNIQLEYRLSFDLETLKNNTYSPNVSENNFHAFNCQWMLNLGEEDIERTYKIQIKQLPRGWESYHSYDKGNSNIEFTASYNQIFSRVLGAANESKTSYSIKGKPLDVFVYGNYELDNQLIISTVKNIILKQREFFDDFDFDFYNVIILPKAQNVAGINITKNTFVCYLKSDVDIEQLSWIIAHEVFHTWLGKKIDIVLEDDARIYRDHWFTEGFTDYFATKIRLDAGIINHEQFKSYVNSWLINIADNPYSNYTLSELENLASVGGYGTAAVKLQYYRGALIALNLEAELEESKSNFTLKDILYDMHLEAQRKDKKFTRKELFTFFKSYDLALEPLFNDYIINGKTIDPRQNALGEDYQLVKKTTSFF